jgi:hypothetical protein
MQEQPGHVDVIRLVGQLIDGIAAIIEFREERRDFGGGILEEIPRLGG